MKIVSPAGAKATRDSWDFRFNAIFGVNPFPVQLSPCPSAVTMAMLPIPSARGA